MSWLQERIASAGYHFTRETVYGRDIARMERRLEEIEKDISALRAASGVSMQIAIADYERRILSEIAIRTPENMVLRGAKVFSQYDEDGIIASIFEKLESNRTCIEIACGNGIENNTRLLLMEGWKGVWVDASEDCIRRIRQMLGGLTFGRLLIERQFIDAENIGPLIERYRAFLAREEVDFFSLDIDGNDLQVLLRALEVFSPRVMCVEYNAKFPPPMMVCVAYDPMRTWSHDDYHGCSLMALVSALQGRYTLLTCNLSGVNAFFVRNDLADRFRIHDPRELYQPPRYHLTYKAVGHPPSGQWLTDALAEPQGETSAFTERAGFQGSWSTIMTGSRP